MRAPRGCDDRRLAWESKEKPMHFTQIQDAVELLQMEYHEMPDLKLTPRQAQRLFNLPSELCEHALSTLTSSGFLFQTGDGSYVRQNDSEIVSDAIALLIRATKMP
jgi:hypothetical protein